MVQSCGWYTWRPTSATKLQKAEENMLKGERQVFLYVYLQKGFSAKNLFNAMDKYQEIMSREDTMTEAAFRR